MAAAHARAEAAAAQVPRCQEDRQAHVPRHVHEGEGERVQEQAGVDGEHPQVEGGEGAREDAVGPVRGAAGKEQGDQGAEDREEGGAPGAGDSRGGPRAGHRGACERGPCQEVEEVKCTKSSSLTMFGFGSVSVNALASGRFLVYKGLEMGLLSFISECGFGGLFWYSHCWFREILFDFLIWFDYFLFCADVF